MADDRDESLDVAVDGVAVADAFQGQRLDHQRHAIAVALGFKAEGVLDALLGDGGVVREMEDVHDHADGVETQGLLHRGIDQTRIDMVAQILPVDIGNVGAENQRGLLPAGDALEIMRLTDSQLDGIGIRVGDGLDGTTHVFESVEEWRLVEDAVVHGDVEAALGIGVEEAIKAKFFHYWVSGGAASAAYCETVRSGSTQMFRCISCGYRCEM